MRQEDHQIRDTMALELGPRAMLATWSRKQKKAMPNVSNYEEYQKVREQIRTYVEGFGLDLLGFGVYPTDPPKIKIDDDGTWTCPHCNKVSEDLQAWQVADTCSYATPVMEEDDANYWDVPVVVDMGEPDVFGYACDECNGWVQPEDQQVMGS